MRGEKGDYQSVMGSTRRLELLSLFGEQVSRTLQTGEPIDLFEYFWFQLLCPEKDKILHIRYKVLNERGEVPVFPENTFWRDVLESIKNPNISHEASLETGKKLTLQLYEWKDRSVHAERRSVQN